MKSSVKKETLPEKQAALAPQDDKDVLDDAFPPYNGPTTSHISGVDLFENSIIGSDVPNYALDPKSVEKFPPLASPEQLEAMKDFYSNVEKDLKITQSRSVWYDGSGVEKGFDPEAAWIQTHSGRRFCPTNPNINSIVIQDISHSLSMQCRFTGHCKKFYSVAQHSVLVSYLCDSQDALWGLLHDASEAYLVDVPRPLKRSGKFEAYLEYEKKMQEAICRRFGLPLQEPWSVKCADQVMLATEARDLMSPLHKDWDWPYDAVPFVIKAIGPEEAKDLFMKRFFELTRSTYGYQHYLKYKDQL
jgi:uncharacterized protein